MYHKLLCDLLLLQPVILSYRVCYMHVLDQSTGVCACIAICDTAIVKCDDCVFASETE